MAEVTLFSLARKLDQLHESYHKTYCPKVEKHHRDLYEGNGKPSLTTRMELQEQSMEAVQDTVRDIRNTADEINKTISRAMMRFIIGVFGMIGTVAVGVILILIKK